MEYGVVVVQYLVYEVKMKKASNQMVKGWYRHFISHRKYNERIISKIMTSK